MVKNFLNISYEGSNGWEIDKFVSGFEGFDSVNSNWEQFQDSILPIKSYDQGLYSDPITQQPKRAGFNRKENKYVANLVIQKLDQVKLDLDLKLQVLKVTLLQLNLKQMKTTLTFLNQQQILVDLKSYGQQQLVSYTQQVLIKLN